MAADRWLTVRWHARWSHFRGSTRVDDVGQIAVDGVAFRARARWVSRVEKISLCHFKKFPFCNDAGNLIVEQKGKKLWKMP
jgi:hypothetical protein